MGLVDVSSVILAQLQLSCVNFAGWQAHVALGGAERTSLRLIARTRASLSSPLRGSVLKSTSVCEREGERKKE